MPARTFPNLGLKGGYDEHEGGWADDMNANLLKLSALSQGTVISKLSATPPSPVAPAVYLFDETHSTHPNSIAIYEGAVGEEAWTYIDPEAGWLVYNQQEEYYEKFDGTSWAELATGGGGGGSGVPDGGTTGQVLTKLSDTDGDADWQDIPPGSGSVPNWVAAATWHWDGTNVVIDSATNVSAINRDNPGIYEIVFDQPAPAADYEVFGSGELAASATSDGVRGGSFANGGGRETTSCWVVMDKESVGAGGGFDAPRMSVMMFSTGALPFGGSEGGGSGYAREIDAPPASPGAWNDEFDGDDTDGSAAPAGWTWFNRTTSGVTMNAGIFKNKLLFHPTAPLTGWNFAALLKAKPVGDFDIIAKTEFPTTAQDYNAICIGPYNSTSGKFIVMNFHARAPGRFYVSSNRWNNFNSLNTDNSQEIGSRVCYLRVKYVSGVFTVYFSIDGNIWRLYQTENETTFVGANWDYFGFFVKSESNVSEVQVLCHWIRDYQADSLPVIPF